MKVPVNTAHQGFVSGLVLCTYVEIHNTYHQVYIHTKYFTIRGSIKERL